MATLIRTQKSFIRYQDDGVLLSDIYLAAVVINVLNGVECYQTVPTGNSQSRFLFYLKGDKDKIKETIDAFYAAKIDDLGQKLTKFISTVQYLKTLLDRSKGVSEEKNG